MQITLYKVGEVLDNIGVKYSQQQPTERKVGR